MMPGNGAGDGQPSQNEWMRWQEQQRSEQCVCTGFISSTGFQNGRVWLPRTCPLILSLADPSLRASSLNAAEQRELAARMEKKQMKEFMTMYSRLVQRCFDDCVNDFTTKSLISREEGCVLRCVDKFLKGSQRLGERFQEQNAALMQSGQLPGR
ncbi:hypothetical protein VTN49DRAFT_2334 [Thermomyces lanuginosus]|uniref:uncharacterized protein n=1 Tax=Thermomyces lanuginosus TaxID=5541 RepID=UPI003742A792